MFYCLYLMFIRRLLTRTKKKKKFLDKSIVQIIFRSVQTVHFQKPRPFFKNPRFSKTHPFSKNHGFFKTPSIFKNHGFFKTPSIFKNHGFFKTPSIFKFHVIKFRIFQNFRVLKIPFQSPFLSNPGVFIKMVFQTKTRAV